MSAPPVEIELRANLDGLKKVVDDVNNLRKRLFSTSSEQVKTTNEMKKAALSLSEKQREYLAEVRKEAGVVGLRKGQLDKFERRALAAAAKMERVRASGDEFALAAAERAYVLEVQKQNLINKKQMERLDAFKRVTSQSKKEMVEGVTEGLRDGISNLTAADFKSLGSLMINSIKQGGGALQTVGAVAGKKSGETTGMLSSALNLVSLLASGAGEVVLILASMFVVIGAVIGAFVHMDNRISGLNKTMMEAGIAAGDFAANLRDMSSGMDLVRESFTAGGLGGAGHDFLRRWMITNEDALKIVGTFNKAGHTIGEMTDKATTAEGKMAALRDNTEIALKYANLLGESGEAMAEKLASRIEETGDTIKGLDQGFSSVYDAAMQSGFGVSRFFNMVLQATAGMTTYNVRLEEAAGLLGLLGKSMSSVRAEQMLGDLAKRKGSESGKERLKNVILTGTGESRDIVLRDLGNKAQDMIADALLEDGDLDKLIDVFDRHGVKAPSFDPAKLQADGVEGIKARRELGMALLKQTGNMSQGERSALAVNLGSERVLDFKRAHELLAQSKVFQKGGDQRVILAEAMQYVGAAGTLVEDFLKVVKVLGRDAGHLSGIPRLALEEMGYSPDRIRDLESVASRVDGATANVKLMQKEFEEFQKLSGPQTAEARLEFQKRQAEKYGYVTDEKGNVLGAEVVDGALKIMSGPLEALKDFIYYETEKIERSQNRQKQEEMLDASIQAASQTTGWMQNLAIIKDVLETSIFGVLKEIRDLIKRIPGVGSYFSGSDEEKVAKLVDAQLGRLEDPTANNLLNRVRKRMGDVDLADPKHNDLLELIRDEAKAVTGADEGTQQQVFDELVRAVGAARVGRPDTPVPVTPRSGPNPSDIETARFQDGGVKAVKTPPPKFFNDFLLRMDGSSGVITPLAQFHAQDSLSILGARPGQAVAQAAASPASAPGMNIHNHFYNDARANYNQSRKLMTALNRGRSV